MKLKIQTLIEIKDGKLIHSNEEYKIHGMVLDPYGEGTTNQEEQPCLTIDFKTPEERMRWCMMHKAEPYVADDADLDNAFSSITQRPTHFVHFWQVPGMTNVEVAD